MAALACGGAPRVGGAGDLGAGVQPAVLVTARERSEAPIQALLTGAWAVHSRDFTP
jgi:hypothetical protein